MINQSVRNALVVGLFVGLQIPAYAIDSASLELGQGNKTQLIRVGTQWDWSSKWWQSNGTHLGGYWDLSLAQWHATRFRNTDATQNITDIGLTPVFRFQRDTGLGLYGELGIGAHYLTGLYDNAGRRLSTHFQFGDHLGLGYVLGSGLDLGVRLQHVSNGGYQQPNSGVNFVVLRMRYRF